MRLHIEANTNQEDAVGSMLKSLSVSVGASDALFHVDLSAPESWLGKSWLRSLKHRESLLFTSDHLEETFQRYKSRLRAADLELSKSVNRQMYSWPTAHSPSTRMIKDGGYKKVVSVSVPLATSDELTGRFLFFYDQHSVQTELDVRENIENVLSEILVFQSAAIASPLINSPLEDYGMLKKSTISIIRHLAQGCSRSELSDIHYMTPRGIDYHLERAKCILGAKSSHHLVHKSHNLLLI